MPDEKASAFKGSFPEFYDRYLVPMNFAPYARILAGRAKDLAPSRVLETAAGTGIVTEELVRTLPPDVTITATDLNQPMIDHALAKPDMAGVTWRQADAVKLPFPDGSFDLVVCQFGVMFFRTNKRLSGRHLVFCGTVAHSCSSCGTATEPWLIHPWSSPPRWPETCWGANRYRFSLRNTMMKTSSARTSRRRASVRFRFSESHNRPARLPRGMPP